MLELLTSPALIRFFALAACAAAVAGSLVSALLYRGRQGQPYSPFNHFISELGEEGVSRAAWAFNLGLVLCGLLVLPAVLGLGLRVPGLLARLGMLSGLAAGLAVAGVGLFPMNNIQPHIRAAMTFFRTGLMMVALFSLAFALQSDPPAVPRAAAWAGMPAAAAYAFFLIYMQVRRRDSGQDLSSSMDARPRLWLLPAAEWATFLTTVPWLAAVALAL